MHPLLANTDQRLRYRLLAGATVVIVLLFAALVILLFRANSDTQRTSRAASDTTHVLVAITDLHQDAQMLAHEITMLEPGDSMSAIFARRASLERRLELDAGIDPALPKLEQEIRTQLASLDRLLPVTFGGGPQASSLRSRRPLQQTVERLIERTHAAFKREEVRLDSTLAGTLQRQADSQRLLMFLRMLTLALVAVLLVVVWWVVGRSLNRTSGMLDRSQARFQQLVETLPAIVYAIPLDTKRRGYLSPQVAEILGIDAATVLRAPMELDAHVSCEDRERIAAVLADAAAGRRPESIEFRFARPDGGETWLRSSAVTIAQRHSGRELQGLLLDVTEARHAQTERDRMELDLRLAQKLEAVGRARVRDRA